MTFLNLNLPALLLGLAGIAGLLYLLQQLRIRYTELPVVTTYFWEAAVQDAPVRVFRERFRHLLAYLLSLLFCWLLWLGFAGPVLEESKSSGFHVLVLDGSAVSSIGDEFARSKQQLIDDVANHSADSREVYFAGAQNVKILSRGENRNVLIRRLDELQPESASSSLNELVRLVTLNGSYPDRVNISLYGPSTVSSHIRESLPPGYTVSYATDAPADIDNQGILALGVSEAISGNWDEVDVLISIASTRADEVTSADFTVKEGDRVIEASDIEPAQTGSFNVRNLTANGAVITVSLNESDDFAHDNTAQISLPERRKVRVLLDAEVPEGIRYLMTNDMSVNVVEEDPDIAILGTSAFDDDVPSIRVVPMRDQDHAIRIGYSGSLAVETALQKTVVELGIDQIDANEIAREINQEISIELFQTDQPVISIWSELLQEDFNFTNSRGFPLFLSNAIRYLVKEQPWYAYIAAGREPYDQSDESGLIERALFDEDPLTSNFVRSRTGPHSNLSGTTTHVSLLGDPLSSMRSAADTEYIAPVSTNSTWTLAMWLILAAIVLLGIEWYLYQRGLMP